MVGLYIWKDWERDNDQNMLYKILKINENLHKIFATPKWENS